MVLDYVDNGELILEAGTEIKLKKLAKPSDISFKYVCVKAILLKHCINKLLRCFCTRGSNRSELLCNEVNRHTSDKSVYYQRNAEQY